MTFKQKTNLTVGIALVGCVIITLCGMAADTDFELNLNPLGLPLLSYLLLLTFAFKFLERFANDPDTLNDINRCVYILFCAFWIVFAASLFFGW